MKISGINKISLKLIDLIKILIGIRNVIICKLFLVLNLKFDFYY